MDHPSGNSIMLEPRISGSKVIVPLDHLSHKERRRVRGVAQQQLRRQAKTYLNDDNALICEVITTSQRHREAIVTSFMQRLCRIIRQAVQECRKQQAWSQQQSQKPVRRSARVERSRRKVITT